MKTACVVLISFIVPIAAYGQKATQPIRHRQACELFSKAVVQVDTAVMHGTGFVADADGYIVTAFHVVADMETMRSYGNITVSFEHGDQSVPAEIVSPLDTLSRTRDFTVLKIGRTKLLTLTLGNEDDAPIGAPITIIGLPLTAYFPSTVSIATIPHFCLTGTVAAQTSFPIGNKNHLDTIYFQGISVKGISGAPIILLDTGRVIGVADTRMTGIGRDLAKLHDDIAAGKGRNAAISGFEPGPEIDKIITVLDQQLANGLGTGTGAADIAYALKKAKRDYEKQHTTKNEPDVRCMTASSPQGCGSVNQSPQSPRPDFHQPFFLIFSNFFAKKRKRVAAPSSLALFGQPRIERGRPPRLQFCSYRPSKGPEGASLLISCGETGNSRQVFQFWKSGILKRHCAQFCAQWRFVSF